MQNFEILQELETPRFLTCSVYPFSFNESNEIRFLVRKKSYGDKQIIRIKGFGQDLKPEDPNVLGTAAVSFYQKTGGIVTLSMMTDINNKERVEERLK